jgi:hypothetical protein
LEVGLDSELGQHFSKFPSQFFLDADKQDIRDGFPNKLGGALVVMAHRALIEMDQRSQLPANTSEPIVNSENLATLGTGVTEDGQNREQLNAEAAKRWNDRNTLLAGGLSELPTGGSSGSYSTGEREEEGEGQRGNTRKGRDGRSESPPRESRKEKSSR